MLGILLVALCVLGVHWYMKDKKQKQEIERIKSLDVERKKIELMKLQGRISEYKTSHVLHLLLTLFLLGLWLIPWWLIAQSNASKRAQINALIDAV